MARTIETARIQEAIQQLVGLPLKSIGRSGSLEWFHFGEPRWIRRRVTGAEYEAGAFALHLDCAWQLVDEQGSVLANSHSNPEVFDKLASAGLVCQSAVAGAFGDFRLAFTSGVALLVNDNDTECIEWWRLFRPGNESPHMVVGPTGVLN